MGKIKIFLLTLLIFLFSFFLSYFSLEFARQQGMDELFRFADPYDLVVKNARIIDGTGTEVYDSSIGILEGRIKAIGKNIVRGKADVFDATGYTLIPLMVEIPEDSDWVDRDLPGAMSRFPYDRIFFKSSEDPEIAGRSLEVVLRDGLYREDDLRKEFNWMVLIAPEPEVAEGDAISSAVYRLTGWRSDSLGLESGKIREGYLMEAYLYRTRDIYETEFVGILNNEVMPEPDYIIRGNEVIDGKTGVAFSNEVTEEMNPETNDAVK